MSACSARSVSQRSRKETAALRQDEEVVLAAGIIGLTIHGTCILTHIGVFDLGSMQVNMSLILHGWSRLDHCRCPNIPLCFAAVETPC